MFCSFLQFTGYQNSGVGNAFFRSMGELNFVTLGFVLFPVSQNSLFVYLLGISFERALAWHRMWARISLVIMLIHGVGMWTLFGQSIGAAPSPLTADNAFEQYFPFRLGGRTETFDFVLRMASNPATTWSNFSGFLSFICFGLMGITSLDWVRRRYFELFYFTHVTLAVPGFVFAFLHMPALARFLAPALLLYLLDLAFRYYRATRLPARLLSIQAFEQARVTVLKIAKQSGQSAVPFEFLPGQYVFLRCAFVSALENHPFSISSAPSVIERGSGGDTIFTLHVRDMGPGTFSHRLFERALQQASMDAATLSISSLSDSSVSAKIVAAPPMDITVDGPYGSPSVDLGDYHTLILVCGGIGITPALSWLTFLAHAPEQSESGNEPEPELGNWRKLLALACTGVANVPSRLRAIRATNRRVSLHWSIPNLSLVPVFVAQLMAVHECIERRAELRQVTMAIHVTRVPNLDAELERMGDIPAALRPYFASQVRLGWLAVRFNLIFYFLTREHCFNRINGVLSQRPDYPSVFRQCKGAMLPADEGPTSSSDTCVFACGPEALVQESRTAADEAGLDFHSEEFLF